MPGATLAKNPRAAPRDETLELRRAVASFPGQETKLMKGLKLNYDLRCAEEARKGPPSLAVPSQNLNPDVLMMKSAEYWY